MPPELPPEGSWNFLELGIANFKFWESVWPAAGWEVLAEIQFANSLRKFSGTFHNSQFWETLGLARHFPGNSISQFSQEFLEFPEIIIPLSGEPHHQKRITQFGVDA